MTYRAHFKEYENNFQQFDDFTAYLKQMKETLCKESAQTKFCHF